MQKQIKQEPQEPQVEESKGPVFRIHPHIEDLTISKPKVESTTTQPAQRGKILDDDHSDTFSEDLGAMEEDIKEMEELSRLNDIITENERLQTERIQNEYLEHFFHNPIYNRDHSMRRRHVARDLKKYWQWKYQYEK